MVQSVLRHPSFFSIDAVKTSVPLQTKTLFTPSTRETGASRLTILYLNFLIFFEFCAFNAQTIANSSVTYKINN